MSEHEPEILFVCVHNAGRSQIAAAFASQIGRDRVVVRSAGSAPASQSHSVVLEAMAEVGIDLRNERPKPLDDDCVRAADAVITMGCGDACPTYPGQRHLDWEVADPAGQPIETLRLIRNDIRRRVTALLKELGVETGAT